MATIRIKLFRAYDSSSASFIGTSVPDMFRALCESVTIETTKAQEAIDKAVEMAKNYALTHPTESFMPSLTVVSGRKPRGFDAATKNSEPVMREWLKPEVK